MTTQAVASTTSTDTENIIRQLEYLRKKYHGDVRRDQIAKVFFEVDPVGLNFDTNTDEYDYEAMLLLESLGNCILDVDTLTTEISDVFCRAFGRDVATPASYRRCAEEIIRLGLMQTHCKTL